MSNIQPYIILNDIDSRTISGLLISSLPPISKPQVRTQVETVDGRDGDLVTPLGFSAYDKVITIGLTYGYDIDDVIEYFNSEGVVVFSNEPDKFYRYAIYEQIDFDKLIRFKKAEVTLHCQPFKFSTTEAPIVRNGSGSISINVDNSGNIYSRPELLLTGSGNATVDLNSSEILSVDLDSANGAIFIDSENMNAYGAKSAINNVIAYINPVQDLHGYDKPWVGGAGKNKFDLSLFNLSSGWTKADGVITNINDPISNNYRGCSLNGLSTTTLTAGTYAFSFKMRLVSGTYTGGTINAIRFHTNGANIQDFQKVSNPFVTNAFQTYYGVLILEESYTFKDVNLQFSAGLTNAVFEFKDLQLELDSTATTYAPYSNICPISGWSECNIHKSGINLWDEVWELGTLNINDGSEVASSTNIRSLGYISVLPNTTYYFNRANYAANIFEYDNNHNFIRSQGSPNTFTTSDNCRYLRFYVGAAYGATYHNDISINYPSTDTSYHAYNGNTYNIDISENPQDPDNPQVIYGGYYESDTGLLNITYGITTINNSINNRTTSYSNPVFYGSINGLKPQTNNILSECFNVISGKPSASSFASNSNNGDFAINSANTGANIQVFLRCDDYADVTSLKNAVGNMAIVFELAEPIQIQLAPTKINNLIGLNQVFTDTNGDVAVDYRASGEAHFEQAPIVSFICTFEDIIKGTLLNRAVTGNYDNIKLNIGLNNLVVNGSGVNQFAIDKYSRWL